MTSGWNITYTDSFQMSHGQRQSAHNLYSSEGKIDAQPLPIVFCGSGRLALTSTRGFLFVFFLHLVDIILEIHSWCLCHHRDLLQESCISCSLQINPVDHLLPALCPLWVGDNWLVIIRHDYSYYFHLKSHSSEPQKETFKQMRISCW